MFDPYVCDGELLCELCADDAAVPVTGEHDFPPHCSYCHRPLSHSLTESGVEYVLDRLEVSLLQGPDVWFAKRASNDEPDYYRDCNECEILREWAEGLSDYRLLPEDQQLVDLYLAVTQEDRTDKQRLLDALNAYLEAREGQ